jgi:hypothetical protein
LNDISYLLREANGNNCNLEHSTPPMKPASALVITFIFILLYSCNKHYDNFLLNKNKEKIIALQPLGNYDTEQLHFISREISSFYNRKVMILPPVNIPETFRLSKDAELYLNDKSTF